MIKVMQRVYYWQTLPNIHQPVWGRKNMINLQFHPSRQVIRISQASDPHLSWLNNNTLNPRSLLIKSPNNNPYPTSINPTPYFLDTANKWSNVPLQRGYLKVTHYLFQRYQQIRIQISHIISNNYPMDTQDWISVFCYNIMNETLDMTSSTSNNRSGKLWGLLCISYHDGVDGATPISVSSNTLRLKYPLKSELGLSWNNGRKILDKYIFSKWYNNMTPKAKTVLIMTATSSTVYLRTSTSSGGNSRETLNPSTLSPKYGDQN